MTGSRKPPEANLPGTSEARRPRKPLAGASPRSPRRPLPRRTIGWGILLTTFAGGCDSGADSAWCVPDSDESTTVVADQPSRWRRPPEFVELWRAGGTRENQVIGYPAALAASAEGWVAIPDFMLGEVVLVSPGGEWTDAWLPRGPGPGEVLQPVAVGWDGPTLLVWDIGGAKVVERRIGAGESAEMRVDGRFNSAIVQSGEVHFAAVQARGSVLSIRSQDFGQPEGVLQPVRQILVRSTGDGLPVDTLASRTFETIERTWPRPGGVPLTVAAAVDGSVAVADSTGAYAIHIRGAGGERMTICRESAPDPLSDEERGARAPEDWERSAAALAAAAPLETAAAIGRLFFDAEGRLWVQRDRPRPFGDGDRLLGVPGGRFDVFSRSGAYLGEVRSPPEVRIQTALGDTVWAFIRGPLDETWVVAYELR